MTFCLFVCFSIALEPVLELAFVDLELRDPPASASQVLGLKARAITFSNLCLFVCCVQVYVHARLPICVWTEARV